MSFSYIDSQFKALKLDEPSEYPAKAKFTTDLGETKWMNVKVETMKEIQALLKRDEEEPQHVSG